MTLSPGEAAARAALRQRQGAGARYDAAGAPHDALLLARRGAAYFARQLNTLSDAGLDAASLRSGWGRRHLIAQIGYGARDLAQMVAAVRQGAAPPPLMDASSRDARLRLAATLPARALRSLYAHAGVHLNVEWRDLPDAGWSAEVALPDGTALRMSETPRHWALNLWRAALELGTGGRLQEVPVGIRPAVAATLATEGAAQ